MHNIEPSARCKRFKFTMFLHKPTKRIHNKSLALLSRCTWLHLNIRYLKSNFCSISFIISRFFTAMLNKPISISIVRLRYVSSWTLMGSRWGNCSHGITRKAKRKNRRGKRCTGTRNTAAAGNTWNNRWRKGGVLTN